jgi:flavin reductase (DIM6/NTAB) family NADH-FMN oxidoreductase RutF
MEIDPDDINTRDMYGWMINTIIPRPIAWVSTISVSGVANLAPFSFFAGVCARPPTVMFCPVNDRFGKPKDTLRNIEAVGEMVIHIVPGKLAQMMNDTSASLPPEIGEFERFNVPRVLSRKVKPPRIDGAPVAYECKLDRVVRLSEGPAGGNAVFCRIVHVHISDQILGSNGLPDPQKLDPVARLGGELYTRLGEIFRLDRPD